jgi:hypothetical protein
MEIANHDWTNQFNFGSVCSFPDCRNQSSCRCFKCLTLYCSLHYQTHTASCNLSYIPTDFQEKIWHFIDEGQTMYISREFCLT